MSYSIDHSIFDSSVDDVNMLSTKRDNKIIQSGRSIIQYEPAIVLDIVLNDSHPMFKQGLGNLISPPEQPVNFRGETPDEADPDYAAIGTALVRLCYSHAKFEKESLIWAVPLDSSMTSVPLLNEVVHVVKIFDKYYYTNKVNSKNGCNTSADFRYEQTYGKKTGNRSYSAVKLTGPISRFDSSAVTSLSGFSGILGNYFWFNKNIRNLRRFEGDTVVEGRFGQSIRMGAYDDNRKNDSGIHDNYVSGDDKFGGGNPMILMRNRQRPISQMTAQSLHPLLNSILPISDAIGEKNVCGYVLEDINNDGSSIHMTSGKTESTFKTTCYKKCFSRSQIEEQPRFSPGGSTSFKMPVFNRDQIVINSDRLILSSRFGESLHFSKKRYSVITDSEYTVDAHDQIVLTTNKKTVINSPVIFLGEYDNTNEPALLGQTTVDWLYDLCIWLSKHTHWYNHSHPGAGAPSPNKTQVPVELVELRELASRLHSLLSRRVYLTGGGYAPGSNGGSITDGSNPVNISNIQSETGVVGVPGGWKGRSRRQDGIFDDPVISASEAQLTSFMENIIEQYGSQLSESELAQLLDELINQSME